MREDLKRELAGIIPAAVEKYFIIRGWKLNEAVKNSKLMVFYKSEEPRVQLAVPASEQYVDYYNRLSDVIDYLCEFEGKKRSEVLNAMKGIFEDRMQFRVMMSEAESGRLPLDYTVAFVEGLQDLVLYAACAEESVRPVCIRKTSFAQECVEQFRFAQTEHGSFIFNVVVPVCAPDNEQLFFQEIGPTRAEPKEHRIVKRIATAFEQIDEIARRQIKVADIIDTAYENGATANICEAMLKMKPQDDRELTLEASFSYSEALTNTAEKTKKCTFDTLHFLCAEDVAKRYRDKTLIEDVVLDGYVTKLSKVKNAKEEIPENTVQLFTFIDDSNRSVTLHLSPEDHLLACDAYKDSRVVRVEGTLDRSGRYWTFTEIRHFTLL